MIPDAIFDALFALLADVVGFLPNGEFLGLDGLSAGSAYVGWLGQVFDMPAIGAAVAVILAGEGVLFGVRLALWIYRLVPVVGGH